MTEATLTANNTGFYTNWTIIAGSRPSLINTDDGNTSCIQTTDWPNKDSYGLTALLGAALINDFIIYFKAYQTVAGSGVTVLTRKGGVDGAVSSAQIPSTVGYTLYSRNDFGRPGGGSWVPGDLDVAGTTEMAIQVQGGTNRCTWMYSVIDYTPTVGGFLILLSSWLPPLIGLSGLFGNCLSADNRMTNAIRAALRRSGCQSIPSSRPELSTLLNQLLVRPRFIFLGG